MKKEELQQTILAVLYYLQEKLSPNEPLSLEETIKEIKNNNLLFNDINYENSSLAEALDMLKSDYRDIAIESIDSFEHSNTTLKNITKLHKNKIKTLYTSDDDNLINLNHIKEKFQDMHEHITSEIERANNEIAQLRAKVKLLEETNNKDPLTKTFNRRALDVYLNDICSKKLHTQNLHLLMLDIDNFKKINDEHGHIAGDKILIFIAQTLKKTLRDGDKVFRYGGEEFVIILNRIQNENCINIANRILSLISGNKLVYKQNTIRVTVSIGGTKLRQNDTPSSILERADKALYNAKESGKNRFIPYTEAE